VPSRAAAESEQAAESRTPAAASETVQLTVSQFEPTELTIAVGTEVSFVNAAGFEHTVTEGTGGQPVENPIVDESVATEGTITVNFDEAGTYELTCRIHPTMHLTITVEG
jgi:plastocyanin